MTIYRRPLKRAFDHETAPDRMVRAWDNGLSVEQIAYFLHAEPEEVEAELRDLLEDRNQRVAKWKRLFQAWSSNDVDRTEVAKRFGFNSAKAAGAFVKRWRDRREVLHRARRRRSLKRLILSWLALANTRWALADLERSRMLDRHSAEALRRGEERMHQAQALADRACMYRR